MNEKLIKMTQKFRSENKDAELSTETLHFHSRRRIHFVLLQSTTQIIQQCQLIF